MKVELKNLGKKYEGREDFTIRGIDLEIESKDFCVILGPSGCGKSTLLRMIAGLNSITEGELLFGDKVMNKVASKDRNIAMVFQSYALYPHMTVYDNMAFSLAMRKMDKRLIHERVLEAANVLQIEKYLYSKPSDISGGQRQRVALGRSIVRKPAVFLMDEPLSNLDANKAMLASGNLSLENGAHIVTQQFLDSFLILSGSGITFGLVVAMLFASKSKQYQALGKVAAFPAIFNVNEPVVFGFPIVMNPVMFVPFILVPVLAAVIVYGAIATGFMQPFSGVTLPWSTPAILSGFMVGGWQGVITQLVILAMSRLVYFPFFKVQDRLAYQNEA